MDLSAKKCIVYLQIPQKTKIWKYSWRQRLELVVVQLPAGKQMIVNMCEINRKQNHHFSFGHQFVNSIQNVTFTVIQPRRMFNKMCYGWCAGVHWIGMFLCYMPYVCFSRDTVWDTDWNAVARCFWHKSNSRKIIIHKSGFYPVLQNDFILTISNRANSCLHSCLYKVPKLSALLSFCKLILPVQGFCRS